MCNISTNANEADGSIKVMHETQTLNVMQILESFTNCIVLCSHLEKRDTGITSAMESLRKVK